MAIWGLKLGGKFGWDGLLTVHQLGISDPVREQSELLYMASSREQETWNSADIIIFIIISNSTWTEWITIQGVIGRVIAKSAEHEARGRFEITGSITPWIVRHEVQLLINPNYNKIQEEYDSGINYLTGWYIQLLS